MRSESVSANPMPRATKATVARGEKPKRRPWKNSFTGLPMLAARRTLRLGGHSAARLPVMSTAALTERRAAHEVSRRDQQAPRKRDLARAEVRDKSGDGAAPGVVHVRTIAR